MLQHAKGNLIDMAEAGLFDIIVHGCNCQNTMGSGIAKEIRERHPVAYRADTNMHKRMAHPVDLLGNYSWHVGCVGKEGKTFTIVNAYTQLNYLPRGVDHFDYESFKLILRKLAVIAPNAHYGFPYIGMGLAGGDPDEIKKILWYFSNAIEKTGGSVTLVEFSG
jgi:O-acetyl-ADP-ribose deacetylase (regulator of RNase III)